VLDTTEGGFIEKTDNSGAGEEIAVQGRSLVVFMRKE
jgi:hypothetical protein